jgi:predicted nucleic acid-binding protein
MKITVTQTEVQYFTTVKEIEMSEKEYAEYLKTGKVSKELENEISSQVEDYDFDYCEVIETKLEKVLDK